MNQIVLPLLSNLQFLLLRLIVYTWLWRAASALWVFFLFFFAVRWAKRLHTPLWLENSFLMGSSKPMGRKGVCFYTFKPGLAFIEAVEKAAGLLKIFDVVFESIDCCVVHVLWVESSLLKLKVCSWTKNSFALSQLNLIGGWIEMTSKVKELLM